jgi:hypothetical protein
MVGPYRAAVLALTLAAGVVAAGCRGGGAATLSDLGGVAELQKRFDADSGKPRIVLLLSPT